VSGGARKGVEPANWWEFAAGAGSRSSVVGNRIARELFPVMKEKGLVPVALEG